MMQVDHETDAASGGGLTLQALVNGMGAVASLALIAGVAVWGWNIAMRDVSGVPVVRALEGPMRVAPQDPGGMQAAYQGLSVNSVAAGGPAVVPERIVLAPAPPSLEDLLAAPAGVGEALAGRAPDGGQNGGAGPEGPGGAGLAEDGTAPAVLHRDEAGPAVVAIPASVPGVARSPVPRPRPGIDLVAETAAMAVLQSLSPGATLDLDPALLTPGTRLVQLGAFDDIATARAEWEAMVTRFGAHMEGKSRVIQEAEAGGRIFFRLRAHGFADEAEARRFCAVLLPENATCIPVLLR